MSLLQFVIHDGIFIWKISKYFYIWFNNVGGQTVHLWFTLYFTQHWQIVPYTTYNSVSFALILQSFISVLKTWHLCMQFAKALKHIFFTVCYWRGTHNVLVLRFQTATEILIQHCLSKGQNLHVQGIFTKTIDITSSFLPVKVLVRRVSVRSHKRLFTYSASLPGVSCAIHSYSL